MACPFLLRFPPRREQTIWNRQYEFDRREREVEALRTLTKEQIVAWRVGTNIRCMSTLAGEHMGKLPCAWRCRL